MSNKILIVLLCAGLNARATAPDVRVGDSLETVLAALGQPQASIESGTFMMMTFDRGRVELRNDKVTLVDLVSTEEALKRRIEAETRAAEAQRIAERRRVELIAEGMAVLNQQRKNPAFLGSSASEQVGYWQSFRNRYPDVNIAADYASALQRLEAELALQRQSEEQARQIRELEARVSDAEQRAQYAESRPSYYSGSYGSWYGPTYVGTTYYRPARYVTSSACAPVVVTPSCNRATVSRYPRHHSGISISVGSGFSGHRSYGNCGTVRSGSYYAYSSF